MSTSSGPILPFNGLPADPSRRYQASVRNPYHLLVGSFSKGKIGSRFLGNGLQFLNTGLTGLIVSKTKMDVGVYCSILPQNPLPSDSSSDSRKVWIFGMIATVILPFLGNKWGPLLKLKSEVDETANKVEAIAEAVEKVAEQVDKVAEEVADDLPAGGKLKEAVTLIENLAEQTAKTAHLVDETIEKVEEVEEQVESLIETQTHEETKKETETEEAKPTPKEANGQLNK